MNRNDWHEAKMGTCGCGRWAKVLDDICAECHDAERQDQREAAYLKRIRELESKLSDLVAYCKDGYGDHEADEIINAEKLLEQPR